MERKQLEAHREGETLLISGFEKPSESESWSVTGFSNELLIAKSDKHSDSAGVSFCSAPVFADFLFGLNSRHWSGTLTIETGYGIKKLFLKAGEIVFASSNLFDDRLGEILYRQGGLTLEQLTSSASKVTRDKKFGQIVIQSGLKSDFELWMALKEQVRQVTRSIFMVESLYFRIGKPEAIKSEVIFPNGSKALIESCSGYGSMFRGFSSSLNYQSVIRLVEPIASRSGTFLSDFQALMKKKITLGELLKASRLPKPYVMSTLMDLVNKGVCEISGRKAMFFNAPDPHLVKLRKFVKAYDIALSSSYKAFQEEKASLPKDGLHELIDSFDIDAQALQLDSTGRITEESTYSMLSQCAGSSSRATYFEFRLRSLIEFLLQITGDHLGELVVSRIRKHIEEYYT